MKIKKLIVILSLACSINTLVYAASNASPTASIASQINPETQLNKQVMNYDALIKKYKISETSNIQKLTTALKNVDIAKLSAPEQTALAESIKSFNDSLDIKDNRQAITGKSMSFVESVITKYFPALAKRIGPKLNWKGVVEAEGTLSSHDLAAMLHKPDVQLVKPSVEYGAGELPTYQDQDRKLKYTSSIIIHDTSSEGSLDDVDNVEKLRYGRNEYIHDFQGRQTGTLNEFKSEINIYKKTIKKYNIAEQPNVKQLTDAIENEAKTNFDKRSINERSALIISLNKLNIGLASEPNREKLVNTPLKEAVNAKGIETETPQDLQAQLSNLNDESQTKSTDEFKPTSILTKAKVNKERVKKQVQFPDTIDEERKITLDKEKDDSSATEAEHPHPTTAPPSVRERTNVTVPKETAPQIRPEME